MFKKVFCDPEIFRACARDVLEIELEIDHVETEKSFSPTIGRVAAQFDLYAEDRKHRQWDGLTPDEHGFIHLSICEFSL